MAQHKINVMRAQLGGSTLHGGLLSVAPDDEAKLPATGSFLAELAKKMSEKNVNISSIMKS